MSSGDSIHSSEKPHDVQRKRVTLTAEKIVHPTWMLLPAPCAPLSPSIRRSSRLEHFGHVPVFFMRRALRVYASLGSFRARDPSRGGSSRVLELRERLLHRERLLIVGPHAHDEQRQRAAIERDRIRLAMQ